MIKIVVCLARKPRLSVEEFERHWHDVHGPLAARVPGLRRYVQSYPLRALAGVASQAPYDGIAELWLDSWDAWRQAQTTAEGQAAGADAATFIDSSRSVTVITEEKVIVG